MGKYEVFKIYSNLESRSLSVVGSPWYYNEVLYPFFADIQRMKVSFLSEEDFPDNLKGLKSFPDSFAIHLPATNWENRAQVYVSAVRELSIKPSRPRIVVMEGISINDITGNMYRNLENLGLPGIRVVYNRHEVIAQALSELFGN